MAKKLHLSWDDIENDCKVIANQVNFKVDVIIAITKGGLPMATILASKYLDNPPVITIQLQETVHGKQKANYQAKSVDLISPLNSYPIADKRVLIVDDVSDTGTTIIETIKIAKKLKPKLLITATLHYKPRTKKMPDIFAQKVENDVWIVYPWD